jgi:hypothetical protein
MHVSKLGGISRNRRSPATWFCSALVRKCSYAQPLRTLHHWAFVARLFTNRMAQWVSLLLAASQ